MGRNREELAQLDEIKKIVKCACDSPNNIYDGVWESHICPTADYSKELANMLKADVFVVEAAALLHDYAAIVSKDLRPEHHTHGAEFAKEILEKLRIPDEKIEQICHCILTHRGSVELERKTIEAEIVASADAMSHFDMLHRLFWIAYTLKEFDAVEGKKWVQNKLKRSWSKMHPAARQLTREKYDAVELALEGVDA